MRGWWFVVSVLLLAPSTAKAAVAVVAAENFYGAVAEQLAGSDATVTSILSNPEQDPHLFEASPSVARGLAAARIVIVNGADYDPWMATLLAAQRAPDRIVITVADLIGRKPGDNPHIWYDPSTMPTFAHAFAAALDVAVPTGRADHARNLATFLASLGPLDARIASIRTAHAGAAVTATEPVFGYMAKALGLDMRNERFQMAVMNDSEPAASDVAAFEHDLSAHAVRALLYNSQASDAAAYRLMGLARSAGIPVVGITETQPSGVSYVGWMTGQLDALDRALSASP